MIDRRMWIACSLGILLAAAPLSFGATSPIACLSLALGASVLALAILAFGARPSGFGWIPMALILALGLFQLAPIPPALLQWLSPVASEHRAVASAVSPLPGSAARAQAWQPISLNPHATMMSLIVIASAACVFAAARFAAGHQGARRVLAGALLGSGFLQALYGIAMHVSGRQEILGSPKLHYTDSATGTFVNRNHFAGYLEMMLMLCLGLLLALAASGPPRREARLSISTPRGAAILMLGTLACVMAAALICSHSRAGVASASAGLFILMVSSKSAAIHRPARVMVLGIVACSVLYVSFADPASLTDRLDRTIQDLAAPGGRIPLWRDSARIAAGFPVLGAGLGTFEHVFPSMRSIEGSQLYRHAHNDYLELAVELGAPGLLLGLFLSVMFFRRAAALSSTSLGGSTGRDRVERGMAMGGIAGVASLALHSFFDFNLHVPANLLTLAAVCALALPGAAALDSQPRRFVP